MADIEDNTPFIPRRSQQQQQEQQQSGNTTTSISNPYSSSTPPPPLPGDRILTFGKRCFYIIISLYILHYYHVYDAIFNSPKVSHEWFKVGLASTIALLGLKAYVEIYEGRIQKSSVSYKTFPHSTHTAILFIILSSIAYHVALWPHYHWNTVIILNVSFFGVILQFVILTPSYIQKIISFILLVSFLQLYQ